MSFEELEHSDYEIVEAKNVGLLLDDDGAIKGIIFETDDVIKILDASAWGAPETIKEGISDG